MKTVTGQMIVRPQLKVGISKIKPGALTFPVTGQRWEHNTEEF